jgi:hypothetical protein
MIANLSLIESNINAREKNLPKFIDNGSDKYKLTFRMKTEKYDIEILKINCYIYNRTIYFDKVHGFHGSVMVFCERVKKLMDGLMHGTVSELNFLDNEYFYGFKYNGRKLTIIDELHYGEILDVSYNVDFIKDNEIYDSITKIINQLDNL